MNINLRLVQGMTFLILFFALQASYAQIPDSCTFVEGTSSDPGKSVKDSVLTIDMESANVNGGFWVVQNDVPGYVGSGFIQYVGGDATGVPGISQLSYTFRIVRPGIHSFKMRAYREGYHDNDVWVRFPQGGVITRIGTDSTGTKGNNWFKVMIGKEDDWYAFAKTQNLATHGELLHDIYVNFPTAGVYTVEFSGRATGFRIDRFYLYKTSSFYGMGAPGIPNPEAAKENCFPYNMGDRPYVANPIPDQSVNGGTAWNFTIPANTFAGTSLDYSSYLGNMQPLPTWMSFNAATQTFTGNPTYQDGGKYTILVKAQDNGKYTVDAFVLTVNGNHPPVMSVILEDTEAIVGDDFSYDISSNFTDPDGHTLTYAVSSHEGPGLPSWLSFSGTTFTGNPTTADVGNDTIYVTVTDGNGGSISESFIIAVKSQSVQGVNSKVTKMQATLYPNPADQAVKIKIEENGKGNLTLSDNMGRVYYSQQSIDLGNEIALDLSTMNLQPGLYILRIRSEEKGSEYNGIFIKK